VKGLVDAVNHGSIQQARGVEQVFKAIHQMEQITQAGAASAEEAAATSEELSAQSESMNSVAQDLRSVVEG
jgi:methyl-accepting chemotaxis protein